MNSPPARFTRGQAWYSIYAVHCSTTLFHLFHDSIPRLGTVLRGTDADGSFREQLTVLIVTL